MKAIDSISVGAAGTTVTSGATSANLAIPAAADGARARAVLVTCLSAAGAAYVKPGTSAVAATANDLPVTFGAPVKLWVKPFTHIAYLQESAAAKLQVQPLEV
jgi:hypothetical protein